MSVRTHLARTSRGRCAFCSAEIKPGDQYVVYRWWNEDSETRFCNFHGHCNFVIEAVGDRYDECLPDPSDFSAEELAALQPKPEELEAMVKRIKDEQKRIAKQKSTVTP